MEIKISITNESPEGNVEETESPVLTSIDDAIAFLGSVERHMEKVTQQSESLFPEDED